MEKESIKKQILTRFKTKFKEGHCGFVNSQKIQDIIHSKTGKKHETIGRVLRKLAETGVIEKKEMKIENSKVASVYYKYIPSKNEINSRIMLEKLKI
jgi:predicted transcriptional regulator